MIGRLHHLVIDGPDPAVLAAFYLEVLALGARRLPGEQVYADRAGHPFCLVPRSGWAPTIKPVA